MRSPRGGVKPQGLGIPGPGLVEPPLAEQGRSQVVVHFRIVGPELQGLGIFGPGLIRTVPAERVTPR